MSFDPALLFRTLLLLSLGLGAVVRDLRLERTAAWAFLLLYLSSAMLQRWIMAGRSFDVRVQGEEEERKEEEANRLFYCGGYLENEKDDVEKTAIREILHPRRIFFRKAAKWALLAIYLGLAVRFRLGLTAPDLLYVAGAIVILFAVTNGHLLVALALNAAVALPSALAIEGFGGWVALVYVFSVCLALAAHRYAEENEHPEIHDIAWLRHVLKRLCVDSAIGACALGAVGVCANRLIPEKKPGAALVQSKPAPRKTHVPARPPATGAPASSAPGDAEATGPLRQALAATQAGGAAEAGGSPSPRPLSRADAEAVLARMPKLDAGLSPEDIRAIGNLETRTRSARNLGEEEVSPPSAADVERLSALLERQPRMSVEDAKKLLAGLPRGGAGVEGSLPSDNDAGLTAAEGAGEAALDLERAIARATKEGASDLPAPSAENLAKMTEAIERAAHGEGADAGAAKAALEVAKETRPSAPRGVPGPPKPATWKSKAPERKLELDRLFERLARALKPLLWVAIAVLAWIFVRKLLAKRDPGTLEEEPTRKLTSSERDELLRELRRIEAARLSASEEVVARYLSFLELMARLNHPKPDSYPAEEFERSLRAPFPKTREPVSTLTDGFCDVYYGEIEPAEGRMRELRESHRRIFKTLL